MYKSVCYFVLRAPWNTFSLSLALSVLTNSRRSSGSRVPRQAGSQQSHRCDCTPNERAIFHEYFYPVYWPARFTNCRLDINHPRKSSLFLSRFLLLLAFLSFSRSYESPGFIPSEDKGESWRTPVREGTGEQVDKDVKQRMRRKKKILQSYGSSFSLFLLNQLLRSRHIL